MSVLTPENQATLAELEQSTWPERPADMEQCIRAFGEQMLTGVMRDAPDVDEYCGYPAVQRSVALEELCHDAGNELPGWFHDHVAAFVEMQVEGRPATQRTGVAKTFGFNRADHPSPPAAKIRL